MVLIIFTLVLWMTCALSLEISKAISLEERTAILASRDADKFTLRIMPLGASITQGYKSSDNNGYRKVLREQLRHAGWPVNMVGSLSDGTMHDNNHEGHVGFRIDQVAAAVENSIYEKPNLILINVGTNDALQQYQVDTAGERLDSLLTTLYEAVPNTTIIISTLLPNTDQPDLVFNINLQYIKVYMTRQAAGARIVLADMFTFISADELQDGTHPTDQGYVKMASVWWAAIQSAQSDGFLSPPLDIGVSDQANNTCEKVYASGEDHYAQTQRGSGTDDGSYVHTSQDMGRLLKIASVAGDIEDGINMAQLVNLFGAHREGALDELVWTRDGDGTYMFLNENNGTFDSSVMIDVKIPCLAKGVRWGDVNNDGLDDFICIGADGAMYVAINRGTINNIPTFQDIGQVMAAPGGDMSQINVRLGDIDGDGRIDYCLIADNGDIHCWRNGGQSDAPTSAYGGYWQDLGVVFTGKGMGDITGVRFVDINGDFRSDWLWIDDTGRVTTYINNRGTGKGSLVPDWSYAGVTHAGMGVAGAKDRVKFGNIYAGNGADYIYVESVELAPSTNGPPIYDHYAHVWKNTGSGGTTLKGDGDYYCDMRGTGADDYVWVSPDGVGYLYGNSHNPPYWDPVELEIFNASVVRKAIHLADFDGDGKCDLWLVDRDSGAAQVWINKWNSTAMNWDKRGVVTGGISCTQGWGVGLYDLGLRFHDINGDHRADYLCMEPDGRTTGALNLGENQFQNIGQIKHTEKYDRANHRWADVNGDGLIDFLWVDKFTGDTWVWENAGPMPDGTLIDGSSFKWNPLEGARYQGADRGANMHFPNLGGLGRADYHQVIPRTNVAYTWFNVCPGAGDNALDDEDPSMDPNLPAYSRNTVIWPLPHNYISYGDSYAAGIGAHCGWIIDEFDESLEGDDCRRCEGSYPFQLQNAGPQMQGATLHFPACSGAVINDMENSNENGRRSQMGWVRELNYYETSGWTTLSIGGNDLHFADAALSCLFWYDEGKCTSALAYAANKLNDASFRLALAEVYNNIVLDAFGQRAAAGQTGFLLIVTGYVQFFYDQDKNCDESWFYPYGGKLTQELRQQMNSLVVKFNEVMQDAVTEAQHEWGNQYWSIVFFDTDSLFENHRFCEPGVDYRNSWFLLPFGTDALADGSEFSTSPDSDDVDLLTYWQTCSLDDDDIWTVFLCDYSIAMHNQSLPVDPSPSPLYDPNTTTIAPKEAAKAMHPKSIGYASISNAIYQYINSLPQS